jgi:hypothetical protein
LRSILANGGAVRGLGRDRNCRECGGCSGDIFFIVVRQKFHSENPPIISEMTDGGKPSGRKSLPGMHYASGRDPAMERTCPAFPTVGMSIIFRKIYGNVTFFRKAHY